MNLARQQIPPYSSKFSKRTFTQPQLVVLACLKIKLGVTYRELMDWLEEMPGIQQVLGLARLPHFTTIHKAWARLSTLVWQVLQRASCALLPSGGDRSSASRHYTQRTKLQIRSLKTTLLVDTRAQTVLDLRSSTKSFPPMTGQPMLTRRPTTAGAWWRR